MEKFEKFIKDIILKAGKETLKHFGHAKVKYTKSYATDVVTEADIASHHIIVNAIKKNFPEHGIISEEDKAFNSSAKYVWIIDPLDGTHNFSRATPLYGVMISLVKDNEVIMAAVYLPCFDELYFASKGRGAYKNAERIYGSNIDSFEKSYGLMGSIWSSERKELNDSIIKSIGKNKIWINSVGSAAVATAYLVDGRRDWGFSRGGGVWDYCPQALLSLEAGYKVTNLSGKPWKYGMTEIVVAKSKLHKKILGLVRR